MKVKESFMVTDEKRKLHMHVELELAVKLSATLGITINYEHAQDRRFDPAIAFGVALVVERVPLGGNQQGVDVTVFHVQQQHIGPAMASLAMLAARCACRALGVSLDAAPQVDDAHHWISMPLGS